MAFPQHLVDCLEALLHHDQACMHTLDAHVHTSCVCAEMPNTIQPASLPVRCQVTPFTFVDRPGKGRLLYWCAFTDLYHTIPYHAIGYCAAVHVFVSGVTFSIHVLCHTCTPRWLVACSGLLFLPRSPPLHLLPSLASLQQCSRQVSHVTPATTTANPPCTTTMQLLRVLCERSAKQAIVGSASYASA